MFLAIQAEWSTHCRRHLTMALIGLGLSALAACTESGDKSEQVLAPAAVSNPSADIDQCSNGKLASPTECAWINGNLNINNSHYLEGETLPYRVRFDKLSTASAHTFTFEWDTTIHQAGAVHHGLDYLQTYSVTEPTANPCLGVSGCSLGTYSTFPVPVDDLARAGADRILGTADDLVIPAGVLTLFGGTITGVSSYTLSGSYDSSSATSLQITFTANVPNPVLAWSAHIGLRSDWEPELTAIHIPGSPYHSRIIEIDGSGGQQDVSLSAAAVYQLPALIVIKHVINNNGRTAVASDFTLNVSDTAPVPPTFPGAESPGTTVTLEPGPYSVTEGNHDGYAVTYSAGCTGTIAYDQTVTCTVTNDDINLCFGVTCPPPANECLDEGVCNESTGECDYAPLAQGTACTDDGELCTDDVCDGLGECSHPAGHQGTLCRNASGICDTPEYCDGVSTTCPANGFAGRDTLCRDTAGQCDVPEYCTGTGAECPSNLKSVALCRASAGICDVAEMCDGVHDTCPPDGFESATEPCRGTFGICDAPEFCTGSSALCPTDEYLPEAVICREVDGVCDVPERCSGSSPLCPEDAFDSSSLCRGAADVCDVPEYCNGRSADCPADAFVQSVETCRSSAGLCDVPEHCTGTSAACPDDDFQPDTVTCRDADGFCDVPEHCTGTTASCPDDEYAYGTECRESAGICDTPEFCGGASPDCPTDSFLPDIVTCREADGMCDTPELCTGTSAFCPDDQFAYGTECREAAGICDTPEFCGGASPDCPTDSFLPDATACREADGICDVPEFCTGRSADCPDDLVAAAGTLCRESTGACDPEEVCDGTSASCPADIDDICTACGVKFYDLDLDREAGEEEARIEGWEVTLTGPAGELTTYTDEDGAWSFEDLPAGDYLICESEPLEGNWLVTTPPDGCFELAIPSSAAENCQLDFGNVCINGGGARSAGFWSNRNGMAAFLGTDRGATALAMLVSLHLVDGNGEAFDPDNYGRFKEWLMRRSARNMAYQLSGQLAATALNVAKLGVDPDRLVWVPGAIGADDLGFLTVARLMREVDAELHAHPYTPEGDPARAYQDVLTRGLDHLNNNMNFLSLEPCDFTFETLVP